MMVVNMMIEVVSCGKHKITIFAKVLNTARKMNVLYMLSHVAFVSVLFATNGASENPSILRYMFIEITYNKFHFRIAVMFELCLNQSNLG